MQLGPLTDSVREVLHLMGRILDTQTFNYVEMKDYELGIQEEYLKNWLHSMVEAMGSPSDVVAALEDFEDDWHEFRAKRSFVHFTNRKKIPRGVEVWQEVKGSAVPCGDMDDFEEGEEDDAEMQLISTPQDLDRFFKDNSLHNAAKALDISCESAADLKVAIAVLES